MKNLFLVVAACCIVFFALGFPTFKAKISKNKTEVKKPTLRPQRKVIKPTTTPPQSRQLTEAQNGLALLVPNITATKSVTVQGGGNPVPGSQLDYSIVVNNAGTDATAVVLTDVLNSNLTLVAGSVKATPIGFNDAYTCIGNVGITVNVAGSVLANDISPDATSLTATILTTTPNGTTSLASDGSFTYTPNVGYSGADIFTYTITSSNGKTGTATATITVSAPIWFVNSAAASNGTGTLASPFKDWSNFATANGTANGPAINETIFIYSGTYAGAATLLSGQKVLGQGATTTLASFAGITVPTFSSPTLPTTSGTNPNLTSVSPASTITLGTGNTLRGFDMGNSGIDIDGNLFGTLTTSEMALTGTGAALRLGNGVLAATFTSVTSTSTVAGVAGIQIQVCSGSISCGNTSLTASASFGLALQLNTASITFGSLDITPNPGGEAILIYLHKTGTITCTSGTISATNAFVMDISGVDAANKAPLAMVFTSVSALGSTKSHGMSLVNTSGSFTVNGSGTTAGSGGTITNCQNRGADFQNCTNITLKNMNFTNANTTDVNAGTIGTDYSTSNASIYLTDVAGITLNNVSISGSVQRGITGKTVSNLTMTGVSITNSGTTGNEGAFAIQNLSGTCSVTSCSFIRANEHIFKVDNNTGNMNLSISNSTFSDTQTTDGTTPSAFSGNGITVFSDATAKSYVTISNCTLTKMATDAIRLINNTTSSAVCSYEITGCTVNPTNAATSPNDVGNPMEISHFGTGTIYVNVHDNPSLQGKGTNLITVSPGNTSTIHAKIHNNTLNYLTEPVATTGRAIDFFGQESGRGYVSITNNTITNVPLSNGIIVDNRITTAGQVGLIDAIITGNSVSCLTGVSSRNIFLQAGNSSTLPSNNTICGKVANNTNPSLAANGPFRADMFGIGAIKLERNNVSDADVADIWDSGNNHPNTTTEGGVVTMRSGVTLTIVAAGTCIAPSNPPAFGARIAANEPQIQENQGNIETTNSKITADEVKNAIEPTETDLTAELEKSEPVFVSNPTQNSSARMMAGETVTVNGTGSGFNLPATKSTTITFSATVSSTPSTCAITNQASVAYTGGSVNSNTTTTNLIVPVPTVVTPSSATSICTSNAINLNATCATGTVNWYTLAAPTTLLGNVASGVNFSQSPTVNTTYTAKCLVGGCESAGTNTALITVTPNNTITLTSAAGTNAQTRCINTALTNITYSTTGATGATFSGLPTGVTGVWASNVVTISGTPTTTTGSPFSYTVTLTGGCGTITATGTITVTPNNTVALSSAAGTNSQSVCINTVLTNITYSTTGATGATFSGLPTGVTGAWASNVATISGTPTTTTGSPFGYTVTLTGGCGTITATGTITVSPNNTITLSSSAGTNAQTKCINTAITNITYSTTGATGATFSGLPTGVTGAWAANVATISGTPTTTTGSPFGYTVTLTGGCGTITATGTITVNSTPAPTNPMATPSTITVSGNTTSLTATGCNSPSTLTWYDLANPTVAISSTQAITSTKTFFARCTGANTCVSDPSANVTVTYNPCTPLGSSPGNVNITWTGLTSTDWNTACNWNPAWVPDATNADVIINSTTNQPLISSAVTGSVGTIYVNSGATLTVSNAGSLTISNTVATKITLQSGSLVNNGTVDVSSGGFGINSLGTTSLTNTGTITLNSVNSIVVYPGSNLTMLNSSVGVINGDIRVAGGSISLTNHGAINYSGGNNAFEFTSTSSVINDGTINVIGGNGISGGGSTITNNACGKILMTAGVYDNGSSTTTNNGLIQMPTAYNFTNTGTFTNNGVLKANTVSGITNNKMVITNACPIFTLGGSNNYTVSGIFTDAGATTSAGSYASNVFTANNTIPAGSQTLYASVTDGTCSFVVPFTFVNEKPTVVSLSPTSICLGSTITLSATCASGTVNWYAAAIGGTSLGTGASFTYAPSAGNGQSFYASCETSNCKSGRTVTSNTVDVNGNINTITLSSAAGTNAQSICINTALTNITYSTTGATGATFSGLPTGVTGTWASNVATISGTPTTVTGSPFGYTVTLTGGCGTITATGTITVSPNNTVTLSSAAGTNSQSVCINTALTNITYATTGATGATFSGLPTGVTGAWASNVATISGTPTTTTGSPFSYTVTLTGGCGTITATGTITVTPANTVTLTSSAGTNAQTVCINTALTNITYATTGATGATFSGLPTGVTGFWASNVATISGTPTTTTGSPFSYTVTLTGGCGTITATGTITVTVPSAAPMVGTIIQPNCTTATGSVPLSGLPSGNWTLTRSPGAVTSTGSTTSSTITTLATGTYTFTVTNADGCVSAASNNAIIDAAPAPSAAPMMGTIIQPTCTTATGSVPLSGLPSGNWTLTRNPGAVSSTGTGTTATVSGLATGTYSFTVTNADGCTSASSSNAVINVQPSTPTTSNVTGGGLATCGTGVAVGLASSQTATNYQLKKDGIDLGSPAAGTGFALAFGLQNAAGTYSVVATATTGGCTATMAGSAIVTVVSSISSFSVSGGGVACGAGSNSGTGGAGVGISLSGSQSGVNYQLRRGTINSGTAVAGTGSALNFPNQTIAGTYTVVATAGTCAAASMSSSAVVTVGALPVVYNVTGGGTACGTGSVINLSNSQSGVNYQLKRGTTNVGSAVAGTGAALVFAKQTVVGSYSVEAINASTACVRPMSGTANITACPTRQGVEESSDNADWAVIAPNPIVSQQLVLEVRGVSEQTVIWQLVNAQGAVLNQSQFEAQSPQHRQVIEVGNLKTGSYILQLQTQSKQANLKVLKAE